MILPITYNTTENDIVYYIYEVYNEVKLFGYAVMRMLKFAWFLHTTM